MIELDDDKARLDVARIHGWLASSYWTPGIERSLVERQIAGSHCLGVYQGDLQIGFARTVTDHASFAWLADVWVDESMRGEGIGRHMVRWFLDHPDYTTVRRFLLATRDAHGVYRELGYHSPIRPDFYLERVSPTLAAVLRDTS